ncbi:leukotriene A-4 hydrolase-like [Leptonychotes weddellii]|uniref:Leukotriene A-4 hydrolase-like n=1 Tax=Leptonychotes weddellii TaxID=9713 RepID=A0A2U3YED5_LEPWE|nr:leukotriene A-4 hydrolase-like [Leptonychotes weddellii]
MPEVVDTCSLASPASICRTKHLHLRCSVDFTRRVLTGTAALTVQSQEDNLRSLTLDTKDLTIEKVVINGQEVKYTLGEKQSYKGSPMEISLPIALSKNQEVVIEISFETSPKSSALQWLTPEQTSGKEHPYLFSQCQAIHCRAVLPCQDTPSVKLTYSAEVSVPKELVALMSAIRDGEAPDPEDPSRKIYKFSQKVPIPCYLIALVVGALESRNVDKIEKSVIVTALTIIRAYRVPTPVRYGMEPPQLCGVDVIVFPILPIKKLMLGNLKLHMQLILVALIKFVGLMRVTIATQCGLETNSFGITWELAKEDDLNSFTSADLKDLSSHQLNEFLAQMLQRAPLPLGHIKRMQEVYNLNAINNSEIRFRWLRLCIQSKWEEAIPLALKMATEQGRMKFTRPLFKDLAAFDKSHHEAVRTYQGHKASMHPVTAMLVGKDLKVD